MSHKTERIKLLKQEYNQAVKNARQATDPETAGRWWKRAAEVHRRLDAVRRYGH